MKSNFKRIIWKKIKIKKMCINKFYDGVLSYSIIPYWDFKSYRTGILILMFLSSISESMNWHTID